MEQFFSNRWSLLVNTYHLVASNGYPGCAVAFGVGLVLVRYATRLNGTPERLHGRLSSNGEFDVHSRTAAVPGTGKGFGDRLIALFCNVAGSALLMIAVFATVSVTMLASSSLSLSSLEGAANSDTTRALNKPAIDLQLRSASALLAPISGPITA